MDESPKSTLLARLLYEKKVHKYMLPVLLILALAAFLATTAILSRNAEALTQKKQTLDCHYHVQTGDGYAGYAVHVHTEDCYDTDGTLVCQLPEIPAHEHDENCWRTEESLTCGMEESDGHTHDESCYGLVRGGLVCGLEETEGHAHDESCYSLVRGNRICGLEENEEHQHTDDCYEWAEELVCGLEEREGHVHSDDCYEWTEGLICGLEENEGHRHSESCYETVTELVCGQLELHTHTSDCYDETGALICGLPQLEEHVHGPGCFVAAEEDEESDPNADVESYSDYAARFDSMDRTGPWNEVLVAVAKTQLGYSESTRNFIIEDGERRGYTRYGDWYGLPYGEWSAMFVSFCLRFAAIPSDAMPLESDVTRWIEALNANGQYAAVGYTPRMGDIVFFDVDQDARGDHAGIVTSVDADSGAFTTIEGGRTSTVEQFLYGWNDPTILGYGVLPERPTADEPESLDETTAEGPADTESTLASITAADGSPLPEDVKVYAYALGGEEAESAWQEVEAFLAASSLPGPSRIPRAPTSAPGSTETDLVSETRYEAFEIGLENVDGAAPEGGFRVSVTLPEALTGRDFELFHLGADGVEPLEAEYETAPNEDGSETVTGFRFVTDSFSPFVLHYTVDFHYTGEDGKTYDFSIPGGGYVTLGELIRALHIAEDDPETEADETEAFVDAVESVSFSDPALIWVGQVGETAALGTLEAAEGLNPAYSNELTGDEIAAITRTEIPADEWLLISLHPFDTAETLTITLTDGTAYTVAVTDDRLVAHYLRDNGELYEVAVTYGEDARLPNGATLRITEFAQDSEEYANARGAVVADMLARGESVDLSELGLAALDISVLDAEGNKIEPAAPVQVDMTIKALPGVEDLREIADTLAVKHHVETEDGVVVETVFDGQTEASFRLDRAEALVSGTPVDPSSVDWDALQSGEDVLVSFPAPVFSTFSVTWGNSGTTSNQVRVSDLSNGKYILYARDAANNNYYALVPGTALTSVPVTVSGNKVQYSGSENLYWDVEVSGDTYYFSFTENGTKYYLAAGTTGEHVQVGTSKTDYGNADSTGWRQWYDYIHSAQDTFLQSYNGTFRTWNVRGQSNWGERSLIYFEKESSAVSGPHATIHYGYMDGSTFVEFEDQPAPVSIDTDHHAYLIYDFDGYQYAGNTYYRTTEAVNGANMTSGATSIQARLRYSSSRWQYRSNNWNNIADDSHIYVVYDKKDDATQGGTPTLKQADGFQPPEPPTITKESSENGDGTNTLALSVSGHTADMEVEKLADVIVVFDISGSMSTSDMSGSSRLKAGRDAINSLANLLLKKTNSFGDKLIRMGLVTFSTDAQVVQELTDVESDFTAAVNRQTTASGGTNWEKALMLANQMAVDSGRATFVIFVTDGNPTFRVSRMNETDAGLDLYSKDSYDTYYVSNNVFGDGNYDNRTNNYNAAKAEAESIIAHKKTLYTIAISSDASKLNGFADDVGAAGKYTATSTQQLSTAFDDIASSIIALMGHSNIQISDGITALTQTVQKSDLVSYAEDDFTYFKGHAATAEDVTAGLASAVGDMVWVSWDPSSERCANAVYNAATGAVEWNMGTDFMPQDGYTYQVRFKVWPSQEAYDLLADLNNGKRTYASLSAEEKAQIKEPAAAGGMYTLKTNSATSYTYQEATKSGDTVTPTGDPSEPGSFPDVDPLQLTTKPLQVKKQWENNYVDSRVVVDHVTMELYTVDSGGSQVFKEITLNKADNWFAANNYISYGLVTYDPATNSNVKIYESGHDFTLRETDDEAHYYELTTGSFRAMFINGTPTILELIDSAPAGMDGSAFHYRNGTEDYYRLDGHVYRDTGSDVLLIATNTHRSYMDLNKVVVDESGTAAVDGTEFEYTIRFNVPTGIDNYETMEKYIWFSVYDTAAQRTLAPEEYTHSNLLKPSNVDPDTFGGAEYANYLVATSGESFTLKIKPGWNVRFLNLPIGTTYSFEETNIPSGYDFVRAEVGGTRWVANMVDGTDQGAAQSMSSLPANNSASNTNTGVSGTIDYANARYSTTYTNRTVTTPVIIQKTAQNGTTSLPGAVFSLYTRSGYEAAPRQAIRTGLTSGADGTFSLGKLSFGTYYLVETTAPAGYLPLSEPIQIIVGASGVTYNQSGSSLSVTGAGVTHDTTTNTYTLTVTNNAGYELPATGGVGSRRICLLGLTLTAVACAGFALRRKRKTV